MEQKLRNVWPKRKSKDTMQIEYAAYSRTSVEHLKHVEKRPRKRTETHVAMRSEKARKVESTE